MRKWMLIFAVLLAVFWSCDTSGGNDAAEDETEQTDDGDDTTDEAPDLSDYESIDSAKSTKWIRYPRASSKSIRYNIAIGDPDADLCNEPGWSYMFYDDGAIIGYEPFEGGSYLLYNAVKTTVDLREITNPESPWGYIYVPLPGPPPIDYSADPILGKWQFCFCANDGSGIVYGPMTAEFDFEWAFWRDQTIKLDLEQWNIAHDPDAHIVWGTDE